MQKNIKSSNEGYRYPPPLTWTRGYSIHNRFSGDGLAVCLSFLAPPQKKHWVKIDFINDLVSCFLFNQPLLRCQICILIIFNVFRKPYYRTQNNYGNTHEICIGTRPAAGGFVSHSFPLQPKTRGSHSLKSNRLLLRVGGRGGKRHPLRPRLVALKDRGIYMNLLTEVLASLEPLVFPHFLAPGYLASRGSSGFHTTFIVISTLVLTSTLVPHGFLWCLKVSRRHITTDLFVIYEMGSCTPTSARWARSKLPRHRSCSLGCFSSRQPCVEETPT